MRFVLQHFAALFLLLSLIFHSPLSSGGQIRREVNLREGCRREIAGLYLGIYEKREQARDYLDLTIKKSEGLKKELAKAKEEMAIRKDLVSKNDFDVLLMNKFHEAKLHVENLESAIADNDSLAKAAKASLEKATQEEEQAREKINKIFVINRIPDSANLGFPFMVDYISPCSKYKFFCKLPPEKIDTLKNLFGETTPEPCKRYASYSRPTPLK